MLFSLPLLPILLLFFFLLFSFIRPWFFLYFPLFMPSPSFLLWLDYELTPTVLCVKHWSKPHSAILGGFGNFRRWGLAGENRLWGMSLGAVSCPKPLSVYTYLLPVFHEVNSQLFHMIPATMMFYLTVAPELMEPRTMD